MATTARTAAITVKRLARRYVDAFASRASARQLRPQGPKPALRGVGREAEYVLVQDGTDLKAGAATMVAGNAALVLESLARDTENWEPKFQSDVNGRPLLVGVQEQKDHDAVLISSEVGRGTIEVVLPPSTNLHRVRSMHEQTMDTVVRVAQDHGMAVLGFGTLPGVDASAQLMTPKQRYHTMHDVLGDPWLSYTVTASDQTHVDIAPEEVVDAYNLGNLLAPVIIALCGNSSVHGKSASTAHVSSRVALMEAVNAHEAHGVRRFGIPSAPALHTSDMLMRFMEQRFLMAVGADSGEAMTLAESASFLEHLEAGNVNIEEHFASHERYVWHYARPRTQQGTIEMRAACQQPWDAHMCTTALHLGLIDAKDEIFRRMFAESDSLPDWWSAMHALHDNVVRHGLGVPPSTAKFLHTFAHDVLLLASAALQRRGLGEELYLDPLFERLQARQNPGQVAASVLRDSGGRALVDHLRLPTNPYACSAFMFHSADNVSSQRRW